MVKRQGESEAGANQRQAGPKQKQLGSTILAIVASEIVQSFFKQDDSEHHQRDEHHEETIKWTRRAFYGLLAYATVTFFLLIAAGFQLHVSRDTEKRQLRAYLAVSASNLTMLNIANLPEGQPIGTNVTISAFGSTPAYKIKLMAELAPYERGSNFGYPTSPTSIWAVYSIIAPGESESPQIHTQLARDHIQSIVNGNSYLYLVGIVTYTDIFQQEWAYKFCFAFSRDGSPSQRNGCEPYNQPQ